MPLKSKKACADYNSMYRKKRGSELLEFKRNYWKRQRLQVLLYYSNGTLKCACCKSGIYEFLSLDHIKGGGTQHRKKLGTKYIFSFLIQAGFPTGYQVLCHNCNMAKAFYKICPHQQSKISRKKLNEVIIIMKKEFEE